MVIPMSNTKSKRHASRLTRKSQITVPSEVRQRLGLKPGDTGIWILRDEEAVLMSPARYARVTAGILSGTYGRSRDEIRQYLENEREGWQKA